MTKKEFLNQIVEGIKAGRLDPCNGTGAEFGEIYTNLPQYYWIVENYYWTVENGKVTEESPLYVDDEQPKFRFGISIGAIESYTKKDFGKLSDDEIKQAMLYLVDDYGVDDWYDLYQESLED